MNWATGFLKKKKKSNLHLRLKHLSVSTMPTFKTARDTVVLQSGFRGDESSRSSPRDAGVQPPRTAATPVPGPLQPPPRAHGSRAHRGACEPVTPSQEGLSGQRASREAPSSGTGDARRT